MSSPNLNIVTLLGSGLTYTSAYLFGIQEQSLPSGDSVEKLIQVSERFGGVGAFIHAHMCMYMHVCTCSVLAAACHHLAAGHIWPGCGFHVHKTQLDTSHLNGLCCSCKPQLQV